jgi:hypothetical protein
MRTSVNLGSLVARLKGGPPRARGSSLSDRRDYRSFCEQAAADDSAFATFRREPVYVEILEHVTRDQGAAYIDVILRDNPDLLTDSPGWYHANDTLGSPRLYEYETTGPVSPVTLRYLKVLSDLRRLFDDLSNLDIVEIGVGYGSQCRLVTQYWPVSSYTLIDIPPALNLARRYLTTLGTDAPLRFESPDAIQAQPYDLCISNYAFSELARPVQQAYADSVVSSSERGYMTCNFISEIYKLESMSRSDLLSLHAGTRWIEEEPMTNPKNAILVWGASRPCEGQHKKQDGSTLP